MDKSTESKENDCPPNASKGSSSVPHLTATPSSSQGGALKNRNYRGVTRQENDLPSKIISELWEKPLKQQLTPSTNLMSPASRAKRRSTPVHGSARKNLVLPTKLHFENLSDSEESPGSKVKQTRGCRRSLSMPVEPTFEQEPQFLRCPKRMRLLQEEKSPFEELSGETKQTNFNFSSGSTTLTPAVKKLFLKSQSDSILTTCSIKSAVEKIGDNPNLIGDGSKSYVLPIKVDGKHQDLKEITCDTLARLMTQKDSEKTVKFTIVDCRYPYEFDGGHIKGALNLYTKKQVQEKLIEPKTLLSSPTSTGKQSGTTEEREVLIFHCEFSSRRGPLMCRNLRVCDRQQNMASYPALFYPELYVLYGGYKEFFSKYPSLCEPEDYVPMDDPKHADKYRRYKSETKVQS